MPRIYFTQNIHVTTGSVSSDTHDNIKQFLSFADPWYISLKLLMSHPLQFHSTLGYLHFSMVTAAINDAKIYQDFRIDLDEKILNAFQCIHESSAFNGVIFRIAHSS